MSSVTPWTEEEEQRLLDLLDRSYLEGRNSQYPKLSFEEMAAMMNREAVNNYKFLRVYNATMLHKHYQSILLAKFRTPAALAKAQLGTAQAASKVVEEAMERSAQADRWVVEITEILARAAATTSGHKSGDLGSSIGLEEAVSTAKAAREYFVVTAEDAERAIQKAKKAVQDAKEMELPES